MDVVEEEGDGVGGGEVERGVGEGAYYVGHVGFVSFLRRGLTAVVTMFYYSNSRTVSLNMIIKTILRLLDQPYIRDGQMTLVSYT